MYINDIDKTIGITSEEGRVCLLPFGEKELYSKEYLYWMNDKDVIKMLGRDDYLEGVDQEQLITYFNGVNLKDTIFLAIYLYPDSKEKAMKRKGMKFIGTLKIYDINLLAKRASIGILIGDKLSWGKGYASEAIELACCYIFNTLKMRKISAGYYADNIGMEKAFIKNGFEIEAIFREHLYYDGKFMDHKYVCKFRK